VTFIGAHRERWGVEPMCKVLQIAPSTYYATLSHKPSARQLSDERLDDGSVRGGPATVSQPCIRSARRESAESQAHDPHSIAALAQTCLRSPREQTGAACDGFPRVTKQTAERFRSRTHGSLACHRTPKGGHWRTRQRRPLRGRSEVSRGG
jgi:hypothetical protein